LRAPANWEANQTDMTFLAPVTEAVDAENNKGGGALIASTEHRYLSAKHQDCSLLS